MEYEHFLTHIEQYLPNEFKKFPQFLKYIKSNPDLKQYADFMIMTLPTPRIDFYKSSDYF